MEDEYDEEESLVMVELHGIMEADFLSQVKQAKVLGLDTDKPLLQLDDYTFSGEYQDSLGTCMLFKDVTDTESSKDKKLEYSDKTNKILNMQRVFLKSTGKPASEADPIITKNAGKNTEDLENKNSQTGNSNEVSEPNDSRMEPMDTTNEQTKHSNTKTTNDKVQLNKDTQAVSDKPSVKKFKGDHAASNKKT